MPDVEIKGGVTAAQPITINETVPTDASKNNPSYTYTYDVAGNLTQIDQLIGAVTYRKTLTYDADNNMTAASVWSVV